MLQPARLTKPRLHCATRLRGASQNQIIKEQQAVTNHNYPYIWITVKGAAGYFVVRRAARPGAIALTVSPARDSGEREKCGMGANFRRIRQLVKTAARRRAKNRRNPIARNDLRISFRGKAFLSRRLDWVPAFKPW